MGGRSEAECKDWAKGKLSTMGKLFAGEVGLYFGYGSVVVGVGSGVPSIISSIFCKMGEEASEMLLRQ